MTLFDRWMELFGWRREANIPWPLAQRIMALPHSETEDRRRYKRRVNQLARRPCSGK